jgi:DNA repair photolyase
MQRPVCNPRNRFADAFVEWIDAPPPAGLEVYEETAASILSENDSPDVPFRWSVNPYRGCQHACAYCYARPTHEYLDYGAGTDFDAKIHAKINAAELLEAALTRKSWRRESIALSGVTDCYQPIEAVYRLTRGCLEACLRHATPVSVITKGYLVVRDIDVLSELARRHGSRVYISIPIADDTLARAIESGAPSPSKRFDAIAMLSAAGIEVGVMVAPIIPGLSDVQVADVLRRAAQAGAKRAGYVALRLPGAVQDVFFERLAAVVPDRVARVRARIRDMRGGGLNDGRFGSRMRGQGGYWESVRSLFETSARRYGLAISGSDSPGHEIAGGGVPDPPPVQAGSRQLPLFPG